METTPCTDKRFARATLARFPSLSEYSELCSQLKSVRSHPPERSERPTGGSLTEGFCYSVEMAVKLQYMVVALLAVAVFGPDKSTAAPAPAPAEASAPASTALPTGNATEPVVTLVVNPWAAGR